MGSMSAIVTSVAMTASRTDRASDEVKPGSLITEPKAPSPANSQRRPQRAAGRTAVTRRTTQRQMVRPGDDPLTPGGAIPSAPPGYRRHSPPSAADTT